MKKFFFTIVLAAFGFVAWAQMYQASTFFDGSKAISTMSSTNVHQFLGVLPSGALSGVLTGQVASVWTNIVYVNDGTPTFVFGGRYLSGTNTLLLSGAGSNDSNGTYVYAPWNGDTFGTRYTNGLAHAVTLLGSYWVLTNAQGSTNYRKAAAGGLVGNWLLVLPGTTPVPASTFSGDTLAGGNTILSMKYSPDKSNWITGVNVTNVAPGSANWSATLYRFASFSNGYYQVVTGTNATTNGAALTNAYLRAYFD
jgi:uncharacterized protein affecting Mg2+/Co2+ transport